jgi:two-component system, chemotaxis family, protein-glutamate methylesterase/glutaminase
VGVILSGNLDDGTSGLAQIKGEGGVAIVQDPEEAMCSGMPQSAIENTTVDRVLPLKAIAAELVRLARDRVTEPQKREVDDRVLKEAEMAEVDPDVMQMNNRPGTPSGFTCPECGGGLWETKDGKLAHFRCRTGHAFSINTLLTEQSNTVEAALWSAMAALKEKSSLARRLADQARRRGQTGMADRFDKQADESDRDTEVVRKVVLSFKDHNNNGGEKSRRGNGHGEEEERSAQCPPLPESVRGDRDPAQPSRRRSA